MMTNGNETRDFAVSLDFAKHIALMAKTSKAHEYRSYLIEAEKKLFLAPTPMREIKLTPAERRA
jgi:phage anti-repressor protein